LKVLDEDRVWRGIYGFVVLGWCFNLVKVFSLEPVGILVF